MVATDTFDAQQLAEVLEPYRDASPREGTVNQVTYAVREAILDGVLPPDAWLREVALSEALGCSRTPIREAINRLEEEGLVKRTPGVGAQVTRLSFEDMSAVYQVRGSLESLAANFVARQGRVEDLNKFVTIQKGMEQATKDGNMQDFHRLNVDFHRLLSTAANNAYLSRLLDTVEIAIRRFGTSSLSQERMNDVIHEHQNIIDAMIAGDFERAGEAAASHASQARASTLNRLLGQ